PAADSDSKSCAAARETSRSSPSHAGSTLKTADAPPRGSPSAARARLPCIFPPSKRSSKAAAARTMLSTRLPPPHRAPSIPHPTFTAPPTTAEGWWPCSPEEPFRRRSPTQVRHERAPFTPDDQTFHQRPQGRARSVRSRHPRRFHPRRPRPVRDPARMRARSMRRMHDHHGWRQRALLPPARRPGGRRRDSNRRGSGRGGRDVGGSARLPRPSCAPMRLLHLRIPDDGDGAVRTRCCRRRIRNPPRIVRKPVSMHRLCEHRRCRRGAPRQGVMKTPPATTAKLLGARVHRVEDPRVLLGHARFVDDIALPGKLALAFARSPYAHARIVSINTEPARSIPGIECVLTSADANELVAPLRMEHRPSFPAPPCRPVQWPVLAEGKVRFVGEAVVAVAAENRALAEDAAAAVEIEWEELE